MTGNRWRGVLVGLAVIAASPGFANAQEPMKPKELSGSPEVDQHEIGRRGDRVVVTGEGPRAADELLFSMAMAPPAAGADRPADDSDQWYITVFGKSNDPATRGVIQAFERDANLAWFVAAPPGQGKRPWAHFNVYFADDPMQKFRFDEFQIGADAPLPMVVVQPPRDGSWGGIVTVKGADGKDQARQKVIDRIEANQLGQPADLRRRIIASVDLYCKKLASEGFVPPAKLVRRHYSADKEERQIVTTSDSHGQPWGPTPPAQPTIMPVWPNGGPAADQQGATLEQLQAAIPDAPLEFIVGQLKAKATTVAAQTAWQIVKAQLQPKPVTPGVPTGGGASALATLLLGLLGMGQVVQIVLKVWELYRTSRKATGKELVVPDDIFALVRDALLSLANKPVAPKA